MSATLKNRLQVLIDDDRLRRLNRQAKEDGVSVGEFVRSAIDSRLADDKMREGQREFLEFLAQQEPIDFGTDDFRELREEAAVRPIFRDEL